MPSTLGTGRKTMKKQTKVPAFTSLLQGKTDNEQIHNMILGSSKCNEGKKTQSKRVMGGGDHLNSDLKDKKPVMRRIRGTVFPGRGNSMYKGDL